MKNCLIVDDVEVTRSISEQIVAALGYSALSAETLDDARRLVASHSLDLILLDWHLRKGSGLDLLREMRAAGSKVKVIMFSGVEGAEHAIEAIQAGADRFLEKPTTKDKLETCLRDMGLA